MKKLFFILILILATQFVFARPLISGEKTDKSNNKPVNAQLDFYFSVDNNNNTQNLYHRGNRIDSQNDILSDEYYSTGKERKGTVDLFSLYDIAFDSTGMEGKGTIEAYTPFVVGPDYWDYSTGMEGIDTENLSGIRIRSSAKDKNAEIERELKQILLHTPGNTNNNDSTFLKVKVLVKEKLQNMMNIGA